jgi:purine-binding chemotaxis protein CheW
MVLDAAGMIAREFDGLDSRGAEARGFAPGTSGGTAPQGSDDEQMQLVSFDVAGQEYGLEITCVQEIVQIPDRITRVPKAAAAVLGVMNLRERLLPVLSMRALFGMEPAPLAEHNRVVVVSLDGGRSAVGMVMDRVKEVLRVPRSLIDPMPPLLAADASLRDITAICRLDGGKRIVSVLSADKIFDDGALQGSLEALATTEGAEMAAGKDGGAVSEEEQFVVFRLMNAEYGVAIADVQEIVRLPETIARVPRCPDFIEGVINLRGTVIPLVDQRRRFGLPAEARNDRQRVMVFTIRGVQTGFIVDSVSEVMRIGRAQIEDAPELSREQAQMIRRVANLAERQRMILLLESDRLLDGVELSALDGEAA